MKRKVAIVQSNYIPWKGYFDLINSVDEFILFDDMQYTKRDWRNRNQIKAAQGPQWLSIPVQVSGRYHQKIRDTLVSEPSWRVNHWKTLVHAYSKAPHFESTRDFVEQLYVDAEFERLSDINHHFVSGICKYLGIKTRISFSMDYRLCEGKTERLIDLCIQAGGGTYISGPSAKGYLEEGKFMEAGLELEYFDYSGYPEYHQLHPPFLHAVSVLDLIFNEGPRAKRFMKTFPAADQDRTGL